MRRPVLALLAVAVLAAGGTALAQGEPEPPVREAQVLRLESAGGCQRDRLVRLRLAPPAGAVFGHIEMRVRTRRVVRLTGVAGAASAAMRLPRGRSLVRVVGETLGGQRVSVARVYRTCGEPRAQAPSAPDGPIHQGGGED